jgi:hypothetical protein
MTPEEHDTMIQRAVLLHALTNDPAVLSEDEVILAIADDAEDFAERDAVLRALRDLNGFGLVHYRHGFAQATRAAIRADELLQI